jgi:hypothetical protein
VQRKILRIAVGVEVVYYFVWLPPRYAYYYYYR